MKRRKLLASIGLGTSVVAGCLSDDEQDGGNTSSGDNEVKYSDYEVCDHEWAPVNRLPEPAEEETVAAIEGGKYETTDELLLPELIDIGTTYITDSGAYYEPAVTEDGEVSQLQVEETLPREGRELTVKNRLKEDVSIDIRIEHEHSEGKLLDDPVLIDEQIKIEARSQTTVSNTDYFGEYTGEFAVSELNLSTEETWRVHENASTKGLWITSDEELRFEALYVRDETPFCQWDEDGNLTW
ncbi:hypothetical protein [Natronococcus occultus]|uniref:Uncharacterized protein n=1 Tax=Natronococcus occultus SP4 TaxID=694430 RepID=L0JWP2_9EURY|nr:hypothetical protein [Natronococcus occultus]AGB36524.1 hypothetical protein Natoc_0664 [Natronococcus occultus SP4]